MYFRRQYSYSVPRMSPTVPFLGLSQSAEIGRTVERCPGKPNAVGVTAPGKHFIFTSKSQPCQPFLGPQLGMHDNEHVHLLHWPIIL